MSVPVRVLATAGVWAVAVGMAARLRHPVFTATLVALGVSLTVLIWSERPKR